MSDRTLHLVRHGPVVVDLGRPSSDWDLAPEAVPRIRKIAEALGGCALKRIATSPQRKAVATARILSRALALPLEIREGLEEHHRLMHQQSPTEAGFRADMRRFFAHPSEVVFGTESAEDALGRFRRAVSDLMAQSEDDEVVMSHGTVISLLIASGGNGCAEDIWASLDLPDHLSLTWPGLGLRARSH